MKWPFVSRGAYEAVCMALADSHKETERWHQEVLAWRQARFPRKTEPVLPVQQAAADDAEELEIPVTIRDYDRKVMQAVEDEVRLSGDPTTRQWMMREVDRLHDMGATESEILQAIRAGDPVAL